MSLLIIMYQWISLCLLFSWSTSLFFLILNTLKFEPK